MRTFLFEEMTNEALEEYTKECCDAINKGYDDLTENVLVILSEKDPIKKLGAALEAARLIEELSAEHVDTLERYLYSYELNKRLDNKITKLENPEVEFED